MPIWIITEQEARVVEREYRVEGDDFEQVQDYFESLEREARAELLVEARTLRANVEIIDVTDVTDREMTAEGTDR